MIPFRNTITQDFLQHNVWFPFLLWSNPSSLASSVSLNFVQVSGTLSRYRDKLFFSFMVLIHGLSNVSIILCQPTIFFDWHPFRISLIATFLKLWYICTSSLLHRYVWPWTNDACIFSQSNHLPILQWGMQRPMAAQLVKDRGQMSHLSLRKIDSKA